MGWAMIAILALATFLALGIAVRPSAAARWLLLVGLLLGVAGYGRQGSPALAGRPTAPVARPPAAPNAFKVERAGMIETMGRDAEVLETADTFLDRGLPDYAIGILQGAIDRRPGSFVLWTALGNALVVYADGLVTPAAELAFNRAATLSPTAAAPPYFLGLAYAQSGQIDRAEPLWRKLLAQTPANAPWRDELVRKLALVDRIHAAQRAEGPG